ncbi:hypothetical protein RBD99_002875 [Salmonella enterica]|nr:hypothetical protein [Salmonella enterica]
MLPNILSAAASKSGGLTPLELINGLPELVRSRGDSLIEYTQDTRLEPICLIDSGLMGLSCMESALQVQLNFFASLYLSATQIGASEINGVSILERLGKFNPTRDPINSGADTVSALVGAISTESDALKFGLPPISSLQNYVSMESDADDGRVIQQTIGKDTLKALKENANLAIGKMFELNLRIDDKQFTIPMMCRLDTIPVPGSVISGELCALAENFKPDPKERKIKVKAGAIRKFQDFIACADILDNHMKTIVKDPTGLYLRSIENARRNKLAGWLSGRPSVATASSIYNITEETAVMIERRLGIDLDNARDRNRLFDKSSMMVLYVFDREAEMVTAYYRRCKNYTRISFRQLEDKGSSDKASDVMKMMNDFTQMKAPSF